MKDLTESDIEESSTKLFRKQLGYVARDIGYLEKFMGDGYAMIDKEISLYLTSITLYEQQYMYDNKVHSVEHRIVSISQPWLRPIVQGKAKTPVEFGARFDLSLDSEGYGRIERISGSGTDTLCFFASGPILV